MKKLLSLLNFLETTVKIRNSEKIKADILQQDIKEINEITKKSVKENLKL